VSTKELYNWKFSSDNCCIDVLSIPLPSSLQWLGPFYGFIILSFLFMVFWYFSVLYYCGVMFELYCMSLMNFGGAT
jgi:hypothetical protein